MINQKFKLRASVFFVSLATSTFACASPWLDTQDPYLRASVTALSNAGIIKAPVTTYPLMYKSIAADLKRAHEGSIPKNLEYALKYIEHTLKYAEKEHTTGVKVKAASSNDGMQSFGERFNSKKELSLFNEVISNHWAVKTSIHFNSDSQSGKQRSYEDSYLAAMLGNWVISVDQISQWWGPGNDTALALSNNADPFPAVRFTRHVSDAIDLPILNWLGPVSFTTYFGAQEHNNRVPNIRLWGARLNFKPTDALEIGFTRTAQWGGQGRPQGLSTFVDLLIGKDNAGDGAETTLAKEPGNQLAGFDFHYAQTAFGQPWGIYGEIIGEDESGGLPSHLMYSMGMETSFGDKYGLYHLFAEYADTYVDCNDNADTGNCAYEHHIYVDGYRRYGRSMGSTYDSDANVLTFGLNRTEIGGVSWYSKLKWMKLNKDDSNYWHGPNPVAAVAENRIQLEGGYRFPLLKGLFNVEAKVYHTKQVTSGNTDTKGELKASWEYRF